RVPYPEARHDAGARIRAFLDSVRRVGILLALVRAGHVEGPAIDGVAHAQGVGVARVERHVQAGVLARLLLGAGIRVVGVQGQAVERAPVEGVFQRGLYAPVVGGTDVLEGGWHDAGNLQDLVVETDSEGRDLGA